MNEWIRVQCPYCFEDVDLYVDPETRGELVQDCDVCCHPWSIRVDRDADGSPRARVDRAQ